MTGQNAKSAFENYLDAFTEKSAAKRQRLLQSTVAEDVAFSNPGAEGRGLPALLAHITGFQSKYPDNIFRINWMIEQHGQVLAEWSQVDPDGSVLVTAHSYARMNDEGAIIEFAGFWTQDNNLNERAGEARG